MDIDRLKQANDLLKRAESMDVAIANFQNASGQNALGQSFQLSALLPAELIESVKGMALDYYRAERSRLRDAFGAL